MILTQTNKQTNNKKKAKAIAARRFAKTTTPSRPRAHLFCALRAFASIKKCRGVVIINCPFPEKNELPKHKRNARVFERAKDKTTSCAPYTREKIVSSTIITFLDKTNLRKQTSVHLLWGQAISLIVEEFLCKKQTCTVNQNQIFFVFKP